VAQEVERLSGKVAGSQTPSVLEQDTDLTLTAPDELAVALRG